jgi:hypothetical protein
MGQDDQDVQGGSDDQVGGDSVEDKQDGDHDGGDGGGDDQVGGEGGDDEQDGHEDGQDGDHDGGDDGGDDQVGGDDRDDEHDGDPDSVDGGGDDQVSGDGGDDKHDGDHNGGDEQYDGHDEDECMVMKSKRKRTDDEGEGSPWELGILSSTGKERVRTVVKKQSDTFKFNGMIYYNDTRRSGGVRSLVTRFEHLGKTDIRDIRQAGLCGLKREKWLEIKRDGDQTYSSPEKRMRTEDVHSGHPGQGGVGSGAREQGQGTPSARGARVGERAPPCQPTCDGACPPVPLTRLCGGVREGTARRIEPGVPPFCPPLQGVADAPSSPSPTLPTGGPRPPPALPCSECEGRPGSTMRRSSGSGRKARPWPPRTPTRRSGRSGTSRSGRPPPAPAPSPARPPARWVGPPGRILPGLVQQRLLQLRQGAGDHHGRQEERDGQGGPLGLLHHHQDGRQQAEDIQREEPEISSSQPKEIEKCKTINERGPRLAYLVNRLDGSSLPTRTRALSSPSRPEEERNKAEVQEDEAERERKKEYEEEKKKKKSQEESNNCMERLSGDHVYLDSEGVEPGLETAAGCSPTSTSSSPLGTKSEVLKEFSPPFSRIGVSPITVTNGSLYATRHQLRNCNFELKEDDRRSQATNTRGTTKKSSASSADLEDKELGGNICTSVHMHVIPACVHL